MKNNSLNNIWENQHYDRSNFNPQQLIKKAKKQRNGQYISIIVMMVTVIILITYAMFYAFSKWNSFNFGLFLMISSLSTRISLELYSLYRKEKQLISMTQKSYYTYLKKYYKTRLLINYILTPICITVYIAGFYLLLPYFKNYFSKGFYTYILISGIISIMVVIAIIVKSTIKEHQYLKKLYS